MKINGICSVGSLWGIILLAGGGLFSCSTGVQKIEDEKEELQLTQVFPDREWLVKTPKEVGLNPEKINDFAALIGGDGVIIKDGYLIKAWGDPAKHGDWASAVKPCFSTLLFFAVHQKKISGVDELVAPWIEKRYAGRSLIAKDLPMSFRHFANMTSGYKRGEAPGTHWAYNDYGIKLYASLLEEVYGRPLDNIFRANLKQLQFQDTITG